MIIISKVMTNNVFFLFSGDLDLDLGSILFNVMQLRDNIWPNELQKYRNYSWSIVHATALFNSVKWPMLHNGDIFVAMETYVNIL